MTTKSLTDDISEFVTLLLKHAPSNRIAKRKVIHDPILGTNLFQPHEIGLIDLPFCQRLRRISQTDVASLVFPSANHNRLEHSLGVTTIAGRIVESIRSKLPPDLSAKLVPPEVEIELRAAAILHDIGQGPFSHLTDQIIQEFPEVTAYMKSHPGVFSKEKPHEMLSHLIVKDSNFKKYFKEEILNKYESSKHSANKVNIDSIADMIAAAGQKDPSRVWQSNIINGPFDADKFDYLQRDAYFSGLRIGIDLDRFLHTTWLDHEEDPCRLKVMTSGAITLEQVLFGKVLLYNTLYQHHKVLAAECAVKGIFEIIADNPDYKIAGRRMDRAIDFLHVSEEDVLSLEDKPPELEEYIKRFLYRDLFKRALVISADNVVNPDEHTGYKGFKDLSESPKSLRELRRKLVNALNGQCSIYDIMIYG